MKAPKLTAAQRAHLNRKHRPTQVDGKFAPLPQEDPRKTALQARCRDLGKPDTSEARDAANEPMLGTEAGRCIVALQPQDRAALWDIWQAVCAARNCYRTRILGQTGQPKGASIAFVPDKLETDQSMSVDLRTAEERDMAAKRGDLYWAGLIAKLPTPNHRWSLQPALDETEGALWRDAAPTSRGRLAVAALVLIMGMHGK
jgi:hypothetical protein